MEFSNRFSPWLEILQYKVSRLSVCLKSVGDTVILSFKTGTNMLLGISCILIGSISVEQVRKAKV